MTGGGSAARTALVAGDGVLPDHRKAAGRDCAMQRRLTDTHGQAYAVAHRHIANG